MKNIKPLQSILDDDAKHRSFVTSIAMRLDEQVSAMNSIKGILVKKMYAGVKSIRPGYLEHLIDVLTTDYIHEYSGMHADFVGSQQLPAKAPASFESYIKRHSKEAERHFWAIADDYASKRMDTFIGKAYKSGRGTIQSYLPLVFEIVCREVDRHTFYEV